MSIRILPSLEEIEIVDGPHAGVICRMPVGLIEFTMRHPTIRREITYRRRFMKTPEGRVAFIWPDNPTLD